MGASVRRTKGCMSVGEGRASGWTFETKVRHKEHTRLVMKAHTVILTLGRWKQEDGVFKASLSYGRSLRPS